MAYGAVDARVVRRFELGDWLMCGVAILQFAAVLAYMWKKRWLEAGVYICYGTATVLIIFLSLRIRQ